MPGDERYSKEVMDHFMHPRNVGDMPDADGVGHVGNPVCGDIMELYIKVKDGRIVDAKFKTFGCGAAIATSSMVTELVKGKTIDEALEISNRAVVDALGGLPRRKLHCSVLAEEALKAAIEDYRKKQGLSEDDDGREESEESTMYEVVFFPSSVRVRVKKGETLLKAAIEAGLNIPHACGGKGVCGSCVVRIDEGEENISPMDDAEKDVLESIGAGPGHRLACRAQVMGAGVVAAVPDVASPGS